MNRTIKFEFMDDTSCKISIDSGSNHNEIEFDRNETHALSRFMNPVLDFIVAGMILKEASKR